MKRIIDVINILNGKPSNKLIWYLDSLGGIKDLPQDLNKIWAKLWSIGAPLSKSLKWLVQEHRGFSIETKQNNSIIETTYKTKYGDLHCKKLRNHVIEYPIKTIDDIDKWIFITENTFYHINPKLTEKDINKAYYIPQSFSPVQQLLQFDIGLENFYFFLIDDQNKMEKLMMQMQYKHMEKVKLSFYFNVPVIYQPENTSTTCISPHIYEKYSLPQISEVAELVHSVNKRFIVHMCGLIKDLLDLFKKTGMNGIHSVTPPPLGNTSFDTVRQKMKPAFTIIGRFNADLWLGKNKTQIHKNLSSILSKEMLQVPFMLWVTTDEHYDIPFKQIRLLEEVMLEF